MSLKVGERKVSMFSWLCHFFFEVGRGANLTALSFDHVLFMLIGKDPTAGGISFQCTFHMFGGNQ